MCVSLLRGSGPGASGDGWPAGSRQLQLDGGGCDFPAHESGDRGKSRSGGSRWRRSLGACPDGLESSEVGSGPLGRRLLRRLNPNRMSRGGAEHRLLYGESNSRQRRRSWLLRGELWPECDHSKGRDMRRRGGQTCAGGNNHVPRNGHRLRIPARRAVLEPGPHTLLLEIRQHQDGLRFHGRGGRRNGRRLCTARFALPQEVHGEFFLLLLVCLAVRCRAEFLVLQFTQGADLLAAVNALHAVCFIE